MRPLCALMLSSYLVADPSTAAVAASLSLPVNHVISAIINEKPLYPKVDLSAPLFVVLNPDATKAVGASGRRSSTIHVGPRKVDGSITSTMVSCAPDLGAACQQVARFERVFTIDADCVINPAAIPAASVRFPLPRTGGKQSTFGFKRVGSRGITAVISVAGHQTTFRFSPSEITSLANASAAASAAMEAGGSLTSGLRARVIVIDVSRPVRAMRLARPLGAGPFSTEKLDVKASDFGSVASIADQSADPDEIFVKAKGRWGGPLRRDILVDGDLLRSCSELVVDNARNTAPADVQLA